MNWKEYIKQMYKSYTSDSWDTISSSGTTLTSDPYALKDWTTFSGTTTNVYPTPTWIWQQQQQIDNAKQLQYLQQMQQWTSVWQQDAKEHDRLILEQIRVLGNRYAAMLVADLGCA